MTKLCLYCKEKPADFDSYLCEHCARYNLGMVNEDMTQTFYASLIDLSQKVVSLVRQQRGVSFKNQEAVAPLVVAISPTINFKHALKLLHQERMLNIVSGLEGDVVECGVGSGGSFIGWMALLWNEGKDRALWGFDSFQGFPPPTEKDNSPRGALEGDTWAFKDVSVEPLQILLDAILFYGIPIEWLQAKATLSMGWFSDTLKTYKNKIALLNIDADLYQSYKEVYNELADKVVPGGIIMLDEHLNTHEKINFPGAYKATKEFLETDLGKLFSPVQRDSKSGKYYLKRLYKWAGSGLYK